MSEHTHTWIRVAHLDSCHSYQDVLQCECGASRNIGAERDIEADPYSMVWMDPDGREPCSRCDALMAGAKPRQWDDIVPASAVLGKAEKP